MAPRITAIRMHRTMLAPRSTAEIIITESLVSSSLAVWAVHKEFTTMYAFLSTSVT